MPPDPVELTPEEAEEAANHERERAWKRDLEDMRMLMSTPEGRRVAHRILHDMAGVQKLGWAGESVHHTSFHAGARNLGLTLLAQLNEACSTLVLKMDEEAIVAPTTAS